MKIDMRIRMTRVIAALCSLAWSGFTHAQVTSGTKLQIVIGNTVFYVADGIPYGEWATLQRPTTPATGGRNFRSWTQIGDVISVNGKPAKGVMTQWHTYIGLSISPVNGRAIADVDHTSQMVAVVEILRENGTLVPKLCTERESAHR